MANVERGSQDVLRFYRTIRREVILSREDVETLIGVLHALKKGEPFLQRDVEDLHHKFMEIAEIMDTPTESI